MAIITKPTVEKGTAVDFTLNKADLALVSSVAADTYYSDTTNWKTVKVRYESSLGSQREVVVFDATQATPVGGFLVSEKARYKFLVRKITIEDFDGGSLTINRGDLTVAEFDILFPFFVRDFVANGAFDANLGEYGYGSESFTQDGLLIGEWGGFGSTAASMNSSAPVQPAVYLTRTYITAHSGGFELGAYGGNFTDVKGGQFLPSEITAALNGGYMERKISASDPFTEFGLYNNNGVGSINVSKIEFFETNEAIPVSLDDPSGVIASQNMDNTVNLSWTAVSYNVTPVTYSIRRRFNSGSGFGDYTTIGDGIVGTSFHDTTVYTVGTQIEYVVSAISEPINGWAGQNQGTGKGLTIV